MNREERFDQRFQHYMKMLMENPNRFILIERGHGGGLTSQERKQERNRLVMHIEMSLRISGITFEQNRNKFRIVITKPSKSGISTGVIGRYDGCTMIIDELSSFDASNPDVISKIWDSLSPGIHHHVIFGQAQHQELEEAVVTGVFPSTGLPVQPISLRSPTTTDIFLPRVKSITSAIRDSAVTPNILR